MDFFEISFGDIIIFIAFIMCFDFACCTFEVVFLSALHLKTDPNIENDIK